ncbi:MAG: hypothetical protein AB7G34_10600 [Hyphomicrobiales bacterium]
MLKKIVFAICAFGFVGAVTLPLATTPAEATFCKKEATYKKGSWCAFWTGKK